MTHSRQFKFAVWLLALFLLSACRPAEEITIDYDPADLRFSGPTAFALEDTFVSQFPDRASGMANSPLAVEWLRAQFSAAGWDCEVDSWEVINFSETVPLNNVVCRLAGDRPEEIVVVAHHDQSPQTIYGADNDGSGIAILLHLAQIFAAEPRGRYSLTFLASDGEEYGMLGTLRYVETHPDSSQIVAGLSLDNVGKKYYDGIDMAPIGQFNNYGPAWLLQTTQDAAAAAAEQGVDIWVPSIRDPLTQAIDQAVPISFMDQGPLVAAGVPAIGFAGTYPPENYWDVYDCYHSPCDTMEIQSPDVLHNIGRAAEALVRQLQTMEDVPGMESPYLYFAASRTLLNGLPLWLIFSLFVLIFLAAGWRAGIRLPTGALDGWRTALPHFLSLWLPLLIGVLSLYLLTAVGLLQRFDRYFALPKNPVHKEPRWLAITFFLIILAAAFYLARRGSQRWALTPPDFAQVRSLALLIVGLAGVYVLLVNPFSLLLIVPVLAWLLIAGRRGAAWFLDLLLFIVGWAIIFYMFYTFGFVILRINFYILWYVMMMIAIPMVGLPSMMVVTAIIAAGLSMVTRPASGQPRQ